jgi:hypothetical protein
MESRSRVTKPDLVLGLINYNPISLIISQNNQTSRHHEMFMKSQHQQLHVEAIEETSR